MLKTEADYSYLGEPTTAMTVRRYGLVGLMVLYGVLIGVLFYLSSSDSDDCLTSQQSGAVLASLQAVSVSATSAAASAASATISAAVTGTAATATATATAAYSYQAGQAASLTASGQVRPGAGTSVYKDRLQLAGVCAKATAMEPLFESSYVMTYIDGTTGSSTVSVLESSSARDLQVSHSQVYEKELAAITTLDADRGLFVGINQDVSATADEATLVAVLVERLEQVEPEASTFSLSFGAEAIYGGNYSVNPQVTRLSASTFALTYFDNVPLPSGISQYSGLTRSGAVLADNSIVLSPPEIFASDANYRLQTTVMGLTDTSYLLVFNTAEETSEEGIAYGPLRACMVTVTGLGVETEPLALELGAVSTLSRNLAAFNMGSARLDDASLTVLVAYSDYTRNFGISVAALSLGGRAEQAGVSVTSTLPLTSGQAVSTVQTDLQMDLDITVFGGGKQFLVVYSDVSNGGKLTTTWGQLSQSGELLRASPDFLINSGNSQLDSVYQWNALAVREASEEKDAQIAIASSLQALDCAAESSSLSVSVMHVLPAPVGVLAGDAYTREGQLQVDAQLSGVVALNPHQQGSAAPLQPGLLYFANTFGELFSSGSLYLGHDAALDFLYVEDVASNTLMTGKVGVAVSESSLLLKV